ncbi:MAG: anti-phage defense protein ZorA [Hyphomicrobiales bacterium]|nr:anti-phage defense protein ZorA [Hyphomicrobiales bacterium]
MSDALLKSFFWKPGFRVFLFWIVTLPVSAMIYVRLAPLTFLHLAAAITSALHGDIDSIARQDVAFSLATSIGALAGGLLVAYGFSHAFLTRLAIRNARRRLQSANSKDAFFTNYDRLRAEIEMHPLLGHAFKKFDETLVHGRSPIANTVRPSAFFNYGLLKERLSGLKIMPSVPGYFVGVGLLLTFIGLVIALSKAAAGTEAAAAGGGAQVMQAALRELLHAATFKFSTSIAGLAASIALSLAFRLYSVGLETSLGSFCDALEERVDYLAPQKLQRQMAESMSAQVDELKAINSEKFFSRLGDHVGPTIHGAMEQAMTPLTKSIHDAVSQLSANSQNGAHELVAQFSQSMHSSAGTELRELGASLKEMHGVMERLRANMTGSGEDFSRRMTDAAENLNRLVADAGANLGQQSDRSRETLEAMTFALKDVFDKANRSVEENLATAAVGASGRLEKAMDRVLGQLEGQVVGLKDAFGGFHETASNYVADTSATVAAAQKQGVESIAAASARAASALEEGLSKAMAEIRKEIETLSTALRASSASVGAQSQAMDQVASRSRESAEVFGRAADAMKSAIEPVTQSNEKLSTTTQNMSLAMERSATALDAGQKSASALSHSITGQIDKLQMVWTGYEQRFAKVDEDLGNAFEKLATETTKQAQILADQSIKIDKGLSEAIDKLSPFVSELSGGAGELVEAVQELKIALSAQSAQPVR